MLENAFYDNLDLKYPEVGILLEDSKWKDKKEKAKIYIPILMPEVFNNGNILEERISVGNAIIINSNYVSLFIPDYIYHIDENNNKYLNKGTKLIVSFIGGDIDDAYVTGIIED